MIKSPHIKFVVEALCLIPVTGAMVFGIFTYLQNGSNSISIFVGMFTFFTLIFHEILVIPLYLICHRQGWVNWASATLGGFIVGAIPAAIVEWPDPNVEALSTKYGGYLVVDGAITAGGWHHYFDKILGFAVFGAAFGFIFWLYLFIRSRLYFRIREGHKRTRL